MADIAANSNLGSQDDLSKQKGQGLIWRMIKAQSPWYWQCLAVVGFLGLFGVAFGSMSMASAFHISMVLHELGHAYFFHKDGIKFMLKFLFPLGAVAAPINAEENERSDKLHWYNISWLLLGGPAVNVALVIVGRLLEGIYPMGAMHQFAADLVYANVLLAAFNLVPVWSLDAGQLFHVIYSSLSEDYDKKFAVISTIAVLAAALALTFAFPDVQGIWGVVVNLIQRFWPLVFLVVFVAGVWHKQGLDNPLHHMSKQAMSPRQIFNVLVVYLALILVLAIAA